MVDGIAATLRYFAQLVIRSHIQQYVAIRIVEGCSNSKLVMTTDKTRQGRFFSFDNG